MKRMHLGERARERQLCAVIGYEPQSRSEGKGLRLHLACGALPECGLRYAGKVELPERSVRFGREISRVLKGLRTPAYPPGVHSPLPSDIRWVIPTMLVEVTHHGWTVAGMLRETELVGVVSRAE